jgi:CubicO group peptidase (beta-lactamase class C family)
MSRSELRLDGPTLDAAFAAVADGVAGGALSSGVLAVANGRESVRVEAFGPVRTDTVFLIASITKPIVATAVMRLVERGRIGLNDPVAAFLPEFAGNGKDEVRLWHLLTHTSGLVETHDPFGLGGATRESLEAAALAAPVAFRPGTRWAYCNGTIEVMATLVRRLTDRDHARFLSDEVLAPLGMADTTYEPTDEERMAPLPGLWADDAGRSWFNALRIPAYGLWLTAADLVRFGQAFLNDGRGSTGYRLLGPATVRAMTTTQTAGVPVSTPTGEAAADYGLGFQKAGLAPSAYYELGPSPELRTQEGFGHSGGTGGQLWVEPGMDLVVVFLTNRLGPPVRTVARVLNAVIAAVERPVVPAR